MRKSQGWMGYESHLWQEAFVSRILAQVLHLDAPKDSQLHQPIATPRDTARIRLNMTTPDCLGICWAERSQ